MKPLIVACAAFAASQASILAVAAHAAPAKAPKCSGSAVQRSICGDATLSALAGEVTRLSAALAGKDKAKRAEVAAADKAWAAERDACGAAYKDCLIERHMERVAALRSAGANDPKSLSAGPSAYLCEGISAPVMVTTAKTLTPIAYLAWGEWSYALKGAQGAYLAELEEGAMRWNPTDDKATLSLPGRSDIACAKRP